MTSELVSSLLLSGGIGLTLGGFGGGGSILAVPMLVLVTHLAPAEAVGTSLAIVGTTSLVGSYVHHRRGRVRLGAGLVFGLSGVSTALLGAELTQLVSGAAILHAFTALMLVVGMTMLLGRERAAAAPRQGRPGAPRPGAAVLAGAGVGLLTGFLGVGGGFLVVPALMAFAGLDLREAIGTSLLVIAINSGAGFVAHLDGGRLDAGLIAALTTAAVAGALVGERVARHVSASNLRRGFGLIVITLGVVLALTHRPGTNTLRTHGQAAQRLHGLDALAPART